jgi:hypothetical protein
MTTESGTELVPRSWQSDELTVMTSGLADIEARAGDLRRYVETHEVTNAFECAEMKQKSVELRGLQKDAEVIAHPIKSVINKAKDWVQAKFNKASNAAEIAKGIADGKIGAWEQAEERRTALEQRQAQERLDRQRAEEAKIQLNKDALTAAEKKKTRIAEINQLLKTKEITKRESVMLLRAAGAQEQADLAAAEADAEEHIATTPTAKVESLKPHVPGSISRKNYSAKCLDRRKFVVQFMRHLMAKQTTQTVSVTRPDGKIEQFTIDWWDYINVSDDALSKTARELKSVEAMEKIFPGVKAEEKRSS